MKNVLKILLALAMVLVPAMTVMASNVKLMNADQLKSQLGNDDVVIIDVRGSWDWDKTDEKITGATREEPRAVERWADEYPKEKTIVLYCA